MSIDLDCQFACKIKCRWPVDFLGLQNAILLNPSLKIDKKQLELPLMHDHRAIMAEILSQYSLPGFGAHGVVHWARVMENGLRIADSTGADIEVVQLFALFHDSRRVNEYIDRGHGLRGGDFARSLRGSLVHLDDTRFDLLYEACRLHTDGLTEADPTIQTCWDADRLDLGRVEILPKKHLLCTDAARGLLDWAHRRATSGHAPTKVLTEWGVSFGNKNDKIPPAEV